MGSKLSLTENRLNPFFLICISLICLLDMYANFICLFIHECIKEHDIYIYVVQYFMPLILYFASYYLSSINKLVINQYFLNNMRLEFL